MDYTSRALTAWPPRGSSLPPEETVAPSEQHKPFRALTTPGERPLPSGAPARSAGAPGGRGPGKSLPRIARKGDLPDGLGKARETEGNCPWREARDTRSPMGKRGGAADASLALGAGIVLRGTPTGHARGNHAVPCT